MKLNLERAVILTLAMVMVVSASFAAYYTRYDEIHFKVPITALAAGENVLATTPHESGSLIYQLTTSEATATLPDAAAGMLYHFAVIAAGTVVIEPQASDRIFGLASAVGDRVRNVGTVGDHVTLVGINSTTWAVISEHGTWSDIN